MLTREGPGPRPRGGRTGGAPAFHDQAVFQCRDAGAGARPGRQSEASRAQPAVSGAARSTGGGGCAMRRGCCRCSALFLLLLPMLWAPEASRGRDTAHGRDLSVCGLGRADLRVARAGWRRGCRRRRAERRPTAEGRGRLMMPFNLLVLVCLAYVIFLFLVAFVVERRAARGRAGLVALAAGLHAVAVDLLHGLDVLRRGRLCGAVGAGVSDDLSWPDAGVRRLVVGVAQAGADRAAAARDLDRRPDFQPLWQVEPAGRDRDADRGGGGDALYRAATAIGDAVVWGLCQRHAGGLGDARPRQRPRSGWRRGWRCSPFCSAPAIWMPTSSTTASSRRLRSRRWSSWWRCWRWGCSWSGGWRRGLAAMIDADRCLADRRLGVAAGALGRADLSVGGGGDLPAAHVSGDGGRKRRRAASGHAQAGPFRCICSLMSLFVVPIAVMGLERMLPEGRTPTCSC